MTALMIFGLMLALMLIGVPVAYAILGSTLVYFLTTPNTRPFIMVQQFLTGIESFTLLAVPFFILAGVIMAHSGIAERIINFANALVGHARGGLAQVNVLNSVIMGGMSGSANADAAVDSKVLVPQMVRKGYGRDFSGAVSAASSLLSVLIPPSIVLVLYGLQAQTSIGDLFLAGILPALLMAVLMSIAVFLVAKRRGYQATRTARAGWRVVGKEGMSAFWALMMPVLLLVGLRAGVFTPTELAAVAVLYTLVVGVFIYRGIKRGQFRQVLLEASRTTGMVLLIIAAAAAFGYVVRAEQIPRQMANLLLGITENPIILLIIINIALLLIGMMIEPSSLIIIVTPILAPLAQELGIDLVHFGIVMALNMAIGGITPPVGTILFTVASSTGSRVGGLVRELVPFYVALLVALALVTFVPVISTFLPDLLGG